MCDVRGENGVDGDIYSWKLPVSFQDFHMWNYNGVRIPGWVNSGSTNNLARLRLRGCTNVKYLPPLRCLPNLRWLEVIELSELEFMEEGDYTDYNFSASKFFPCLEELVLEGLPKLNRWWGKLAAEVTTSSTFVKFPLLCELKVKKCLKLELNSFPLCPHVRKLEFYQRDSPISCSSSTSPSLEEIKTNRCKWQSSLASLRQLNIYECSTLKSLNLASPLLQEMYIENCNELMSIKLVVAQHLQRMSIRMCGELKSIELVEANTPTPYLWELKIEHCKELKSLHIPAHLIFGLKKWKISGCRKCMLVKSLLPSPFALDIDGCSLIAEMECMMVGGELLEQLSLLPIQDIQIDWCVGAIRFQGTPFTSVRGFHIDDADGLEILHLAASPHLKHLFIRSCCGLTSVEVKAPTSVAIALCPELKNLRIAYPNALELLTIFYPANESMDWDSISNLGECSCIRVMILRGVDAAFIQRLISSSASSLQSIKISEYEGPISFTGVALPSLKSLCVNDQTYNDEVEGAPFVEWSRDVSWDSVPNLRFLRLYPLPSLEELPQCLVQRQALGQLQITLYFKRPYLSPCNPTIIWCKN